METVAVVIPTLNEERAIGSVIELMPVLDLLKGGFKTTPYVIGGHSTDATREIAARTCALIIFENGKGKGIAIRTALKGIEADYVIMVDGNDTYPLDVIPQMVELLQAHDVVDGSRHKGPLSQAQTDRCAECPPPTPRVGAV